MRHSLIYRAPRAWHYGLVLNLAGLLPPPLLQPAPLHLQSHRDLQIGLHLRRHLKVRMHLDLHWRQHSNLSSYRRPNGSNSSSAPSARDTNASATLMQ